MRGCGRHTHVKTFNLRRDLRKFCNRQFIGVSQNDRAKQCVLELAHIARPVVAIEQSQSFGADAANLLALFSRKTRAEPAR